MLWAIISVAAVVCAGVCEAYEVWDPVTLQTDGAQHRLVSPRLRDVPAEVLSTVNDWHYAMMNDLPRNEAFEHALRQAITKETEPSSTSSSAPAKAPIVLDLGAGAGLLSAMAAKLGAGHVYSVEASPELAKVARSVMRRNGLADRVTVLNAFSTSVEEEHLGAQRADVLVSEILGTFLLGEGDLHYMADARQRLLKPGGAVIPAGGTQYVTVVSSDVLASMTHVTAWHGLDLTAMNVFKDTDNVVFTKQYGVTLRELSPAMVSDHLPIFGVDFRRDVPGNLPREVVFRFKARCSCDIHALVFHWEAWMDPAKQHNVSTWTVDEKNLQRDVAWGAGLQLVTGSEDSPGPLRVTEGEALVLRILKPEATTAIQGFLERDSFDDYFDI